LIIIDNNEFIKKSKIYENLLYRLKNKKIENFRKKWEIHPFFEISNFFEILQKFSKISRKSQKLPKMAIFAILMYICTIAKNRD
jgi:hypothetical protein